MNAVSSLRYPTAFTAALLITGSLFFSLNALTDVKFDVVPIQTTPIDFSRQKEDTDIQNKRVIEKPIAPPIAVIEGPFDIDPTETNIEHPRVARIDPTPDVGLERDPRGFGSDTDVTPIVRVNPVYPPRAAAREIEGWVRVRYTISVTGSVLDAAVVASDPTGVFDDAAVTAIQRWRFNPKVDSGVAVERPGMETLLRFTLE